MTVFVAAKGFAAKLVKTWIPAECALHIELKPLPDGGAVIFEQRNGYIPGLGRAPESQTGQSRPDLSLHGQHCHQRR